MKTQVPDHFRLGKFATFAEEGISKQDCNETKEKICIIAPASSYLKFKINCVSET